MMLFTIYYDDVVNVLLSNFDRFCILRALICVLTQTSNSMKTESWFNY